MSTAVGTLRREQGPATRVQSLYKNHLGETLVLWRVVGAYACHAAVCFVWMACMSVAKAIIAFVLGALFPALRRGVGIQSWHWWLLVLSLQLGMLPAVVAYIASLDTRDALLGVGKYDAYVPRLVSSRLVKIAGRVSSAEGCVRQAIGLGLRVLAGLVSLKAMEAMWMGGRSGAGSDDPAFGKAGLSTEVLAVACAVAHHAHCVYWSRDVLVFPSVGKHRWVRWRARLAAIFQRVGPVVVVACGWYVGLSRFVVPGVGDGARSLGLATIFEEVFFGTNLLLLFSLGDSMVDIVMTERPRLGDYDSKKVLDAMQGCLDGKRGELMGMLAMYDLSLIPSDGLTDDEEDGVGDGTADDKERREKRKRKAAVWRRQQIFADETGVTWNRLSSVCMDALTEIVVSVERVEALATEVRKACAKDGANAFPTKWNSMPARGAVAGSEVNTEAVHSLLDIAGHHQAIVLSIRFLSDMGYVSVDEDRYGVLQLSEPSLGDIVFTLLWVDHKIRQLSQWTQGVQSVGGIRWRASGEELYSFRRADACLDVIRSEVAIALENLISVFGIHALNELLEANAQFKAAGDATESVRAAMKGTLGALGRGVVNR